MRRSALLGVLLLSSMPACSSGSGGGAGGAGATTTTASTSTTGSSSGAGCDFAAANLCDTADDVGAVSGSGASPATVVVKGTTARWVRVRVVDDITGSGFIGYRARVLSPQGMRFDLYDYFGSATAADCSMAPAEGAPGNDLFSTWMTGPDDDSTVLVLEVRYVEGAVCAPPGEWTLTITGGG